MNIEKIGAALVALCCWTAAASAAGEDGFAYVSFREVSARSATPAPEVEPVSEFTFERRQALRDAACWHFGLDDRLCGVSCDTKQDRVNGVWDWVGLQVDVYVFECWSRSSRRKSPTEREVRACGGTVLFGRESGAVVSEADLGSNGKSEVRRTDPALVCATRIEPVGDAPAGSSPIPF